MSRKRSSRSKQTFTHGQNPPKARPRTRSFQGLPARTLRLEPLEDRLVLSPVLSPVVSFVAKQDFSTSSKSYSMSLGDLNSDGRLDMAVANYSSNTVSVLLNTTEPGAAAPSFADKQDFATGSKPNSVSLGDLNGDGMPDLAVANYSSNTVSVLLNTTEPGAVTPSFADKQDFITGSVPSCVSLGDVNGDGKLDLAVTNWDSNTVSVLLNTTVPGATTPSFAAMQDFGVGSRPSSVSFGDVNSDGKLDLAVANWNSNTVSVLLNTTMPGATAPSFAAKQDSQTGSGASFVSFGDVNSDGRLDLAVTNYSSNTVSVLLNTTTPVAAMPSFAAKQDFGTGSYATFVSLGDLDGDGKVDLAVANGSSAKTVSVLLNTTVPGAATPSFAAKQDFSSDSSWSMSLGDLNGDGKLDLAVANDSSNTVSVLLNTTVPQASFAYKRDFSTGSEPGAVSFGDVNGDGRVDLATADFSSDTVSVLLDTTVPGAATPTFAAKIGFATGDRPTSVSMDDLNGDGRPDLAVANYGSNTVSVLLNTTVPGATQPSFAAKQDFVTGGLASAVSSGDINGDGRPDLVVANWNSHTVSVLLNSTAPGAMTLSFTTEQCFIAGYWSYSVSLGDFNGDGRLDLAVADESSDTISVLLNTTEPEAATASFATKQDFAAGINPSFVAMGDVNCDGKPDLVATNYSSHAVSVFLNTTEPGATTAGFAAKQDFTTNGWPTSVALGDLNGDGRPDLAVASSSSSLKIVSVLLNTTDLGATTPSFAAKQDFSVGSGSWGLSLGDVNCDGRLDLAVANLDANTVAVLLNTTVPPTVTWTGAAGSTWSTAAASTNWKKASDNSTADFGNAAAVIFSDAATQLAIDISSTDVFPGSVYFNNSANDYVVSGAEGIAGSATVLKQGTGKVTISSVNSYSGVTTVEGGTLQLSGAAAWNPVLNLGGANIKAGTMIFDYTGEGSPAETIQSLLTTSYHSGSSTHFNVGKFQSSSADANHGLGWFDDGTSQVTVVYTLYGDATLDGAVDISDLSALSENWNGSGKKWAQGDFNYDGSVDISDLSALGQHWNQSIAGFSGGIGSESGAVVPEASTLTEGPSAVSISAALNVAQNQTSDISAAGSLGNSALRTTAIQAAHDAIFNRLDKGAVEGLLGHRDAAVRTDSPVASSLSHAQHRLPVLTQAYRVFSATHKMGATNKALVSDKAEHSESLLDALNSHDGSAMKGKGLAKSVDEVFSSLH
jgi:autotransporter-associated beta strand protein